MADTKNLADTDVSSEGIRDRVYTIRGLQVMLDSDLAYLYGYSTKAFNQQVKNNIEKFPEDMRFQLTTDEVMYLSRSKNLTSIIQTTGMKGGRTYLPYVFTEQGIYMLMTVLKGELATKQSIALVRMFKELREYISQNSLVFERLERIEMKQLEADKNFEEIFAKLDEPREKKEVIFDGGTFYDAISHLEGLISSAKHEIILIDGYVNTSTLDMLSKKQSGVSVSIYTNSARTALTQAEIAAFNKQYRNLTIKPLNKVHDRFLILDRSEYYYLGTSANDKLGGKVTSMIKGSDAEILNHLLRMLTIAEKEEGQ